MNSQGATIYSSESEGSLPVNGRWLANLSAWGKVIECTAEMLHKRSEIRWLHTNQSTLEFERRKTNLNVRIGSKIKGIPPGKVRPSCGRNSPSKEYR